MIGDAVNFWDHARLSTRKFGGQPDDYLRVHKFLDSSKLFYHHIKHRLLLHNLYGIELAMNLFGDYIENSDRKIVLVREIGQAHCREDLAGRVPTLGDWLGESLELESRIDPEALPRFEEPELEAFLWKPYLRSGRQAALAITFSDFGVYLVETFFGVDPARAVAGRLGRVPAIKDFLQAFRFHSAWQYTPRRHDIDWLRTTDTDASCTGNEIERQPR